MLYYKLGCNQEQHCIYIFILVGLTLNINIYSVVALQMSPYKVHPESSFKTQRKQQEYLSGRLNIPAATKAQIYESLDSNRPQKGDNSGRGFKNQLIRWFPNGLLWTKDNDSGSSDDEDIVKNNFNINAKSKPVVVDIPHNSNNFSSGVSSAPAFMDVINSFQEGDRVLNTNFSDSDDSGTDIESLFIEKEESGGAMGDIISSSSEDKVPEKSRPKKIYNFDLNLNTKPKNNAPRRRRRRAVIPDHSEICQGVPAPLDEIELSCYTCESNVTDSDPKCDSRLFKYLRHSEKMELRGHCFRGDDQFCMKRVHRRYKHRWTERGCVKGPILLPGTDGVPTETAKKEGCYTYPHGKYLTTACFCKTNLCNRANPPVGPCSLFSVCVISLAFFFYGIAFVFFHAKSD